ncbi:MAG: hypothetical protein M3P33_04085 [bacterium]|nr:hypothetical protein [bacterium]
MRAVPADEKLGSLSNLAMRQIDLENQIEEAEKELDTLKQQHRKVSELDIPELMNDLAIVNFKLSNGLKVTVKPWFSGNAKHELAFKYLDDIGHGDIIKGEIAIPLARGFDRQVAAKIERFVSDLGLVSEFNETVHHSTMGAFLKEMITSGQPIDRNILNVTTGFKTKIGR